MLAEEGGKNSEEQLTLHLKELEKKQTKPKVIRGKEKIKIRTELNKIEKIKNHRKINKTQYCFLKISTKLTNPKLD